jgi:hypothetical protein
MPLSQINSNAIANNSVQAADLAPGLAVQYVDTQSPAVMFYNAQNVTSNIVVSNTYNAFSAGPITINLGQSITVNTGGTYTII